MERTLIHHLSNQQCGTTHQCSGWIYRIRDMGQLIFLTLRDATGMLQLVADTPALLATIRSLRVESAITVQCTLQKRSTPNPKQFLGAIEGVLLTLQPHANASVLPFNLNANPEDVQERVRLAYRYLDLRRPQQQHYLRERSRLCHLMRSYLIEHQFCEVQTPILGRPTPEGAREYLVPSRIHPGHCYALPQSPQQYKQLLMIGGLDRYFQIAPCFRDEDLRADRQPEFWQLDVEMSFTSQETFMELIEKLLRTLFPQITTPLLRITYQEALQRYGTDKPDLRFQLPLCNLTQEAEALTFQWVQESLAQGAAMVGLVLPQGANHLTRRDLNQLVENARATGGDLSYVKKGTPLTGPLAKGIPENWLPLQNLAEGDLLFVTVAPEHKALTQMGALRLQLGHATQPLATTCPLWVTHFPLFHRDANGQLQCAHHPFTAPVDPTMLKDPDNACAASYDLVMNGYELASGSVRIHDPEVQKKIFQLLAMSAEAITERFGYFIEALQYGTPPHLGCGIGIERLVMLATGTTDIKDVVAFPKTHTASDLMTRAPHYTPDDQLAPLHLQQRS